MGRLQMLRTGIGLVRRSLTGQPVAGSFAGAELAALPEQKSRPSAVYLGDYTGLCRSIYGQKLLVDTRDMTIAPHLLLDGFWEAWIVNAMLRRLRPRMRTADVGAHVGYFAVLMAKVVGPGGHVIAVEANPRTSDLCRRNLNINGLSGWSEVHQVAASDRLGEISFHVATRSPGSGSIHDISNSMEEFGETPQQITVKAVTLDELTQNRPLDFVKLDCEGSEPLVLRGAQQTIKSNPRIEFLMEYGPAFYARETISAMLDQLQSAGLKTYRINEDSTLSPLSYEFVRNTSEFHELLLTRETIRE